MNSNLTAKASQFELWERRALFRICQPKVWAKHRAALRRAERGAMRRYFEGWQLGLDAAEDGRTSDAAGGERVGQDRS